MKTGSQSSTSTSKATPPFLFISLAATVAMLFWGLSFVWTKVVFEVYQPFTVVFGRMLLSGAALWLIGKATRSLRTIDRPTFRLLVLLSFFEPFCYFIGESFGLQRVSATVAAVIIATIPLFMTLLAPIIAKERVGFFGYAGVATSFAGVLLTVIDGNANFRASLVGIALLFFAVFSAIGYNMMASKLASRLNVFSIVTYQNLLGIIWFAPFFLIFEARESIQIIPSANIIWSFLALTFFASTISFILYNYVIGHVGIVRANIYTNLIPIFAALFSFFILHEQFTVQKSFGIALVLSGVALGQCKTLRLSIKER